MRDSFDLVVVGGGAAGVAAALTAAAAGAAVALVRTSPGASALSCGGWWGPLPPILNNALTAAGVAHDANAAALPHPFGSLRRPDAVPAWHAAAVPESGALVCGIAGLGAFHAPTLARLWGDEAGVTLSSVTLQIEQTPAAGWSPVSLAAQLERTVRLLAVPLTRAVREAGAVRAILPAVLGVHGTAAVRAALEAATGVPVGEALGVPPSLPGWRLGAAFERSLDDAGIHVIEARVSSADSAAGRVNALRLLLPAGATRTIAAADFLLATGKYTGGGVRADRAFSETVLGLPVWLDHLDDRFETPDTLALTDPVRMESQPLMNAGVRIDAAHRPVDMHGVVVFANVRAAGAVCYGTKAADALGAAAAEGVAAVESITGAAWHH